MGRPPRVARWEAIRSFPAHAALGLSVLIDGEPQVHPGGTIVQGSIVECSDPLSDRRLGFVLKPLLTAKSAKAIETAQEATE